MSQRPRVVDYRASPTLTRFHRSTAFVRGVMGPVGGGKSSGCVMELMRIAGMQAKGRDGKRHTRFAIIRNSYRELADTTVKTFRQWVTDTGPSPPFKWNGQDMTYHITAGDLDCEILFRALDRPADVKKLLSLELTAAYVNEAREMPKAIIDGLTSRVGRYPAQRDGGPSWFGVIMDTNPPDTDHWWYRVFEEERPDGWAMFRQPSALGPLAENLDHLTPGYYQNQIAGKDEDWIRVYLKGEYGFVREGKPVFPEFSDAIHVSPEPLTHDPAFPILIGVDFGLTPAAVYGQRDVMGRWRLLDELIGESIGIERFGEVMRQDLAQRYSLNPESGVRVWADPAGNQRAQTDEKTCFQILRAAGFDVTAAPSNNITLRLESVRAPLSRLVNGKPGLLISPTCTLLRKAFGGGYHYRRVQVSGTERYHDEPEKDRFSHCADATGYLLSGGGEASLLLRHKQTEKSWNPLLAAKRAAVKSGDRSRSWITR